jgi:hypothetical protein
MNADLFSYYLIDTSKLREIGYQDLEVLIDRFPYCQNLHYLVAKKSHVENHPDFEKWLNKAATYSTDRSYLYQLLHEVDFNKEYVYEGEKFDLEQLPAQKEDVSPLESLFDDEKEEDLILLERNENGIAAASAAAVAAVALPTLTTIEDFFAPSDEDEKSLEEEEAEPLITLADLMKMNDAEEQKEELQAEENEETEDENIVASKPEEVETVAIPTPSAVEKPAKPLPKSSFSSWKKKNEPKKDLDIELVTEEEIAEHKRRIEEKMTNEYAKKKKKDSKKKKKATADDFIDRSLDKNENIASETLAKILALQGRKDDAIAMFEKLKLQNPEKSSFFAAEIEKFKK